MSRTKKIFIFCIFLIFLIAISFFIMWRFTMTHKVKFHVIDAGLTKFAFIDDNQRLLFDLNVNMTVKNPNRAFGVFFDVIEVAVLYQDIRFSNVSLSPFYQDRDGLMLLKLKFDGQQLMNLDEEQLALFALEKLVDVFTLKLELRLQMRVNIGIIKIKLKPKVRCGLNVPLISRGRSFLQFQIIGCHVVY